MEDKELIERSPTDKQEGVKASGVAGEPSSEDLKRIVADLDGSVGNLIADLNEMTWNSKTRPLANKLRLRSSAIKAAASDLARALTAATKRLEERERELREADAALLYLANNAGRFRGTAYVLTQEPYIEAARARLARQQEERR